MKQALVEVSQKGGSNNLSKRESHQRERSNVKRQFKQMLTAYSNSGDESVFSGTGRYKDGNVMSQAHALTIIKKMGIPDRVLNKPFFGLDNQDIRDLATAVRRFYRR
jgi:hypothetical protein